MNNDNLFNPRMPEVDIRPELGGIFNRARAAAAESSLDDAGISHNQIIIVTPGRLLIRVECPRAKDIPVEQLAIVGELVPPEPKVNIAVIAYTYLEALQADMRRAVPFIDFLLGFGALGHHVWMFEGHSSALVAGCKGADLLLVDEEMAHIMDTDNPDWRAQALAVMRGDTIRLVSRKG